MQSVGQNTTLQQEKALSRSYSQFVCSEITIKDEVEFYQIQREFEITLLEDQNPRKIQIQVLNSQLNIPSVQKKQEEIKQKVNECINYLVIKHNELDNTMLLTNHNEILEKWTIVQKFLTKNFTGQGIERYIMGLDAKFKNHDLLLNDLMQYRLFGLLFPPINIDVEHQDSIPRTYTMENMVEQIPMQFSEEYSVSSQDKKTCSINLEATQLEPVLYEQKINNHFLRLGLPESKGYHLNQYRGHFELEKDTKILNSANLNIISGYGEQYQKSQYFEIKHKEI